MSDEKKDEPDIEWSEQESRALRGLDSSPINPPAALKGRVMGVLQSQGRLRDGHAPPRSWKVWAAMAAILIVGFGLGRYSVQRTSGTRLVPGPTDRRFIFLLSGDLRGGEAAIRDRGMEYGEWVRSLRARGVPADGEELIGETRVLPAMGERVSLGGFFVVAAKNEADAMKIAETTPHLRYGGTVTVSEVR